MKTYVWLTFAFMGWAYYEMSGGADFQPQERHTQAPVEQAEPAEPPLIATRADTSTLSAIAPSEGGAAISVTPAAYAVPQPEPATTPLDSATSPQESAGQEDPAPASAPPMDLREVAGSFVNMRLGPGTTHGVVTTLPRGTEVEVREVSQGWARLEVVNTGQRGWMAERLLTDPS
ncbi:MAG: SH3 domain-containing protein [Alphaproteobacteria bacterium]|jgi:hypothetical protein|nr:SH3 domain-containing protein [Alphaproteobacteria bacterium]